MGIEPLADARNDTAEVISSDDMMSKFDRYNEEADKGQNMMEESLGAETPDLNESTISEDGFHTDEEEFEEPGPSTSKNRDATAADSTGRQDDEVIIVGADAKVLYPSLKADKTARVVKKVAMETEVKIEGVNYKEVARYIAMCSSKTEIKMSGLNRVLPVRRFNKGTTPGVTGNGPLGPTPNDEEQWVFPRVELMDFEKKKLFATALEIGVKVAFRTNIYQFGGRWYHQADGGPIGLRLAGAAARVVMGEWDAQLMKILADNNIETEVFARYVDDIRIILKGLDMGWRWGGAKLEFRNNWLEEDRMEGLSKTERTSRVLRDIMNSIYDNIQFEMETPEDYDENKLPTLDLKCWMLGKKIMYEFYEKPMTSKFVIMKKSALSENTKVASLSQDLIRRLKNTSERLKSNDRVRVVDNFTAKLAASGYKNDQIKTITVAGIKGYEKAAEKERTGNGRLHRSAAEGAASRQRKKLLGRSSWFKDKKKTVRRTTGTKGVVEGPSPLMKKGMNREYPNTQESACPQKNIQHETNGGKANQKEKLNNRSAKTVDGQFPTTTVLFIPNTPGGILADRLRQTEKQLMELTGERVKIVERGGCSMKQILHKSNPWAGAFCGRPECFPCKSGDEKGDCFKRNIVYETFCLDCKKEGKDMVYVGESSRTSFERGKEHQEDYRKMTEDSHMCKHAENEHHGQEKPSFAMKLKEVKTHFGKYRIQKKRPKTIMM